MKFLFPFCCAVAALGVLPLVERIADAETTDNAKPASEADMIKKLKKQIDERDAVIQNLLLRVDRLERRDEVRPGNAETNAGGGAGPHRSHGKKAAGTPRAVQTSLLQKGSRHPQPPAAPGTQPKNPAAPKSEPGQFTVDPQAAQHALERALVQTGALLLQPGQMEIVPSVSYQTKEFTRPDQLALTTTGHVFVTQDMLRTTLIESNALLRIGLPWDSQIELATSYDYASSSGTTQVVGSNISNHSLSAWGLGDSSLTLIKQITKEGEWMPGLFVSGTANLGRFEDGLPLGTGFDWFKGSVVAVKRQDPLVFTAGFAYQTNLENQGILPGDEYIPSVGMFFAISPETTLQFSQQLAFVNDTKFRGVTAPGSSQVQGIFQAGILSILAPGIVANFTAAIGETRDAPDLTLQLSFPIRLN